MTSVIPGVSKPRNSAIAKLATSGRASKLDIMKGGVKDQSAVRDHQRIVSLKRGKRTTKEENIYFMDDGVEIDEKHKTGLQAFVNTVWGKPQTIEVRGHTSLRRHELRQIGAESPCRGFLDR
ncbi:MAG: hypothetical protein VB878_21275 [Pirellulaceae bacterium]